jgi:hypothetical protein
VSVCSEGLLVHGDTPPLDGTWPVNCSLTAQPSTGEPSTPASSAHAPWAVIGAAIGGAALLAIIVLLIARRFRRRHRTRAQSPKHTQSVHHGDSDGVGEMFMNPTFLPRSGGAQSPSASPLAASGSQHNLVVLLPDAQQGQRSTDTDHVPSLLLSPTSTATDSAPLYGRIACAGRAIQPEAYFHGRISAAALRDAVVAARPAARGDFAVRQADDEGRVWELVVRTAVAPSASASASSDDGARGLASVEMRMLREGGYVVGGAAAAAAGSWGSSLHAIVCHLGEEREMLPCTLGTPVPLSPYAQPSSFYSILGPESAGHESTESAGHENTFYSILTPQSDTDVATYEHPSASPYYSIPSADGSSYQVPSPPTRSAALSARDYLVPVLRSLEHVDEDIPVYAWATDTLIAVDRSNPRAVAGLPLYARASDLYALFNSAPARPSTRDAAAGYMVPARARMSTHGSLSHSTTGDGSLYQELPEYATATQGSGNYTELPGSLFHGAPSDGTGSAHQYAFASDPYEVPTFTRPGHYQQQSYYSIASTIDRAPAAVPYDSIANPIAEV